MNKNQKLINGLLLYFCQSRKNEDDIVDFLKQNDIIENTQKASDDFSNWLAEFNVTENVI